MPLARPPRESCGCAERGTRIAEGASASKTEATIATTDFIDSADLTEAVDWRIAATLVSRWDAGAECGLRLS